jgi:KDO2-lipid IV(A) lauroyltransferase
VQLTDALIIPMASYREGNKYVIELFPAWDNYPEGDVVQDVARMNRYIEKMVLQHPSEYLWLHKRFKTQPNKQRGILYKDC